MKPAALVRIRAVAPRIGWHVLLYAAIALAIVPHGFVASSDAASSWFAPWYNAKQLLSVWSTYGVPGSFAPNNFTSFFLRLYYSLIAIVTHNPETLQKSAWTIFFCIFGSVCLEVINRYYIRNIGLAWCSVLFLFFNPIASFFAWGKQHWAYYLIVPYFLSIHLYLRYVRTGSRSLLFGNCFLWLAFGFAFNQPAYFLPYVIIQTGFIIWFFFYTKASRTVILDHILFGIAFICINAVYIVPLALGGNQVLQQTQDLYAHANPLPILHDLQNEPFLYSFLDITKGYGSYFLEKNNVFVLFWAAFMLIIFGTYIFNVYKPKSATVLDRFQNVWIVLLVVFLFLNKGLSHPFPELSERIYSLPGMYILRDFKDKLALGITIVLSFLYIYTLSHSRSGLRYFLIGIAIASYLLFAFGTWLPAGFRYSDSLSYLSSVPIGKGESRVLNLPLTDYSFFWNGDPFFSGDNPLKNVLHRDVLFTTNQTNVDAITVKQRLANGTLLGQDLYAFLDRYAIQYVLVQKYGYVKEDPNPYAFSYARMEGYRDLRPVASTSEYVLYRYTGYEPPVQGKGIQAYMVGPGYMQVRVDNISTSTPLTYLETYSSGWKLFLHPITETGAAQREIRDVGGIPVFDSSHVNVEGYANQWTLDPVYIRTHYPASYYRQNNNGTLSFSLDIYFLPQRTFYFGLALSVLSCVCVLLVCIFVAVRKRLAP